MKETVGNSSNSSGLEEPLTVDYNRLTVPINGFLVPSVVLLTLTSNVFVCTVLSRPALRAQPSNVFLLSTAVTNTLTGLLATPFYLYFFAFGRYEEWIPFELCFVYSSFTDVVPTMFHTSSVWLTVALALQRYIVVVCKSQSLKRRCTPRNAWLTVAVVLVASGFCQSGRFFETIYSPVEVPSRIRPGARTVGCSEEYAPFTAVWGGLYFYAYYWFRIVFIHLLPCCLLIVLNSVLVRTMREAASRRRRLLVGGDRKRLDVRSADAECRKSTESDGATLMMVCVVGVCLVVELPLAVLFFVVILQNHMEALLLLDEESEKMASTLINLAILSSYQLNFFIYCTMSAQFRTTFRRLFCCHDRGRGEGEGRGGRGGGGGGRRGREGGRGGGEGGRRSTVATAATSTAIP